MSGLAHSNQPEISRVPGKSAPSPSWAWTLLGVLTIPMWGAWPALAVGTASIPPLESLTLAFAAAWVIMWPIERRRPVIDARRARICSVAFGVAEVGSGAFFLAAIRHIAPAEANLTVYLWPATTVFAGALCGLIHLRARQVAALAIGFGGVALLLAGPQFSASPRGLAFAFLAGSSWAGYCVLRIKWPDEVGPFLARGFAVATVSCLVLHLLLEPTLRPSLAGTMAAIGVGAIPTALANVTWDLGYRRGDANLLTVLAYATPLCSALLLAMLGLEPFSARLGLVAILIAVAGALSRTKAVSKNPPRGRPA